LKSCAWTLESGHQSGATALTWALRGNEQNMATALRRAGAKAAASGRAGRAEKHARQARGNLTRIRDRIATQAADRARRETAALAAGTAIPGTRPVAIDQHCRVRAAQQQLARAEAAAVAGRQPPPPQPAGSPGEMKRNLTDPDSRIMKTRTGWIQGFNGQLVVSADYLILAAELSNDTTDMAQYQPMITTTCTTITTINTHTGAGWKIGTVLADAGYACTDNLTAEGPDRLIALGNRRDHTTAARTNPAHGDPPADATERERMDHQLRTEHGATLYRQRGATVEPVNAHLKDRRGLRQFSRRGLPAANSEFRFAATVTNLLRMHTHLATTPA